MSMGLRQSRNFAKRQRRRRLLKWIFILAVFAGLGIAGFQSGKQLAQRELHASQEEIARLKQAAADLERQNADLRAETELARMREAKLQQLYDKEVPTGEQRILLDAVREQLERGADPDRLRFLISAASRKESCAGNPVTKRFLVRTPLYEGANASVTFADGALTVTASGEASEDENGRPQAWFDPARPLTLSLARLGETPDSVSGKLPLQHAIVVNGAEYRLSVVEGERRGFVNVTADRCDFP